MVRFIVDMYSLQKHYSCQLSSVSLSSADKTVFNVKCFEKEWTAALTYGCPAVPTHWKTQTPTKDLFQFIMVKSEHTHFFQASYSIIPAHFFVIVVSLGLQLHTHQNLSKAQGLEGCMLLGSICPV